MKVPLKSRGLMRAVKPAFTHNLFLKLVSLTLAIGLYWWVHGSQDAQRTMAIDLVVLLPPESVNRSLVTPLPTSVLVTMHGPRSLLDDLRPVDLGNLQLDLRSGQSGRISLEPSMLRVPGGVTIDFIDPASIDIAWDEVVERDIHVQVSIAGDPGEGFVVKGAPTVRPATLRARGPRQLVENLQYARAEPFDVTNLIEGAHTRTLAIDRPPPRVTYDSTSITSTVEIGRKLLERVFSKVPVVVVGAARATTMPARVDVRVIGPPKLVEELRPEQIVPRVNLSELNVNLATPNSVALPVSLELGKLEVSIVPKTVVVKW